MPFHTAPGIVRAAVARQVRQGIGENLFALIDWIRALARLSPQSWIGHENETKCCSTTRPFQLAALGSGLRAIRSRSRSEAADRFWRLSSGAISFNHPNTINSNRVQQVLELTSGPQKPKGEKLINHPESLFNRHARKREALGGARQRSELFALARLAGCLSGWLAVDWSRLGRISITQGDAQSGR